MRANRVLDSRGKDRPHMPVAETIEHKLKAGLAPVRLTVTDQDGATASTTRLPA